MDDSKIEEIIKEIVAKHGIAISRDDPILVLHTMNERLMRENATAQQEQLDQYKEEMAELSRQWGIHAKEKAERILNASITASKEIMREVAQTSAKITAEVAQKEMENMLERITAQAQNTYKTGIFNIIASCITVLSAAIVLWTMFG